jgi:hypothetical protein
MGLCGSRTRAHEPDHRHHRLLRARGERPSRQSSTKEADEIAPFHVALGSKSKQTTNISYREARDG